MTEPDPDVRVVSFRMNGVGNAFLRELGCRPCPGCDAPGPRANTSGSLIVATRDGPRARTIGHTLFDCGVGVVDSLIDAGIDSVSAVFLSHNHTDHLLGLDRLANCHRRSGGALPLSVHCTEGTLNAGPKAMFPWLFPDTLAHRSVTPGSAVELGMGVNLRVTPLAVWHGRSARDPVIWVVEFGDNPPRKIVLAWDLLHLVPRYPADDIDPSYPGDIAPSATLTSAHRILEGADELFVESNTYTPRPRTGHLSSEAVMRSLIPLVKPARTWLVHYSGHEDPFGPLTDPDLQDRIDRDKVCFGLADHPIRVAPHGVRLSWSVA